MSREVTFWTAIGPARQKALNGLIYLVLIFTALPVFMDEGLVMGVYATAFALYAFVEFVLAFGQVFSRTIDGVTFLYRLWWCFLIMLLLVLAFLLSGLMQSIYR